VTSGHNDPPPQRYRIRVRGRLGETIRSAFPALQARASGADTVLTGPLPDPAALHGVLAKHSASSCSKSAACHRRDTTPRPGQRR
jgi:hypothetical protein